MKVGDLVRCSWQPECGEYDKEKKSFVSPVPIIENKIGIIIKEEGGYRSTSRFRVLFTHIGYEHMLVGTVLESVNESR
tara:strand:- start:1478 stop:1711 length:234 start_codon:yes stop_codon:yes gene_type:complete